MFIKSLLTLSVAVAVSSAHANEFVLEKLAKPSSQHVSLTLDPAQETFSGMTEIALEVLKPTNYRAKWCCLRNANGKTAWGRKL
jgi:alanyl aminopeptidase